MMRSRRADAPAARRARGQWDLGPCFSWAVLSWLRCRWRAVGSTSRPRMRGGCRCWISRSSVGDATTVWAVARPLRVQRCRALAQWRDDPPTGV